MESLSLLLFYLPAHLLWPEGKELTLVLHIFAQDYCL